MNTLKYALRQPLSVFDSFKHFTHTHPKQSNHVLLFTTLFLVFVLGRGSERLVCRHPVLVEDQQRRAKARYYLPYFVRDYRFNFVK